MAKKEIVLVNPVRTPFGKYLGSLVTLNARDLAAKVVGELMNSTDLPPDELIQQVDEFISGWAMIDSYAPDIGRVAALDFGSISTKGVQVNNGIGALEYAVDKINAGEGEFYVVFGVESCSAVRNAIPKTSDRRELLGHRTLYDPLQSLYEDTQSLGLPLGFLANELAQEYGITREEQDEYAALSHKRAFKASKKYLPDEIITLEIPAKPYYVGMPSPRGPTPVVTDEGIAMGLKASDLGEEELDERYWLADQDTITWGNAAQLADGAVGMLVMTEDKANELGLTPLAYITGINAVGTPEGEALLAPSIALEELLDEKGLDADDIGLLEMHELFAVQVLANLKKLGEDGYDFPIEKVNVKGGAIAMGDAYAATSLRAIGTLAREMERTDTKYGAVAVMTQVGVGRSVLLERR